MITITISSHGAHVGQITVDPPAPPQLSGDLGWLNVNQPVLARRVGRWVMLTEDPVEWALGLPDTYPNRNLDIAISKSSSAQPGQPATPAFTPPQPGQPATPPPPGQPAAPAFAPAGFAPSQAQAFPTYPAAPQVGFTPASVQRQLIAQSLQLSGWWRRVGAAVLDGLIVGVPNGILEVILLHASNDTTSRLMVYLLLSVLGAAYFMLTMGRTGQHNGQTLGKQILEIRVVRDDGAEFSVWYALLRQIVCMSLLSSFTLGIYGFLDYLWPLADGSRRALHDQLVQTHVVREWVSASKHSRDYAPYRTGAVASPPTNKGLVVLFIAFVVLFGLMMIGFIILAVHLAHHATTVTTVTTFSI